MKDLCEVVLDALDLHASYAAQEIHLTPCRKRLIVGSGSALPTAKVTFSDESAVFCDEGQWERTLERDLEIDSAVVVSASGTKHAPIVVKDLTERGLEVQLVTCNGDSPAAKFLPTESVFIVPSNVEPITYNVSTFMGMMLTKTREDTLNIKQHILDRVVPMIGDLTAYDAFYLIVPPEFDLIREMFVTKFDELFGGRVNGRCYTSEQTMHAKTVVPWDRELFIGLGYDNSTFGLRRLNIPLNPHAGAAAVMAIGYFVIGNIQSRFPPWFKEHAEGYRRIQDELFRAHVR